MKLVWCGLIIAIALSVVMTRARAGHVLAVVKPGCSVMQISKDGVMCLTQQSWERAVRHLHQSSCDLSIIGMKFRSPRSSLEPGITIATGVKEIDDHFNVPDADFCHFAISSSEESHEKHVMHDASTDKYIIEKWGKPISGKVPDTPKETEGTGFVRHPRGYWSAIP